MSKNSARYAFVFLLAVLAVCVSYRLNNRAYINNVDLYKVLQGNYPARLVFTERCKTSIQKQLENAASNKAHLLITSSFKRQLNHPHLFMAKLQDVLYWQTSGIEQYKFSGNVYSFYITCGHNNTVHVAFTLRMVGSVYYVESIMGLDLALIDASRVFAARQIYTVGSITIPSLEYADAFNYWDSTAVQTGILSGEYDTSIHRSVTFQVKPKPLVLPAMVYHNAIEHIHAVRDYLYKLIPVAHHPSQISDSLDRENYDTLEQRLFHLEYGGACAEHALIVQRTLLGKFSVNVFTLKKDSHQLIDHVIDLVYYRDGGVEYGVTVDALLGIIGPVKSNGSFYTLKELQHIEPLLNYPAERKTKRYTIDTLLTFSNVFSQRVNEFYADNGFIYYEGQDDFSILSPKELVEDKMPRKQFDEKYAHVLATILLCHIPPRIKDY